LPSVPQAAARRQEALTAGAVATLEQLLEPYARMVRLKAAKLVLLQLGLPVARPRKRDDTPDPEIEELIALVMHARSQPGDAGT
jgi:hypothetical protein